MRELVIAFGLVLFIEGNNSWSGRYSEYLLIISVTSDEKNNEIIAPMALIPDIVPYSVLPLPFCSLINTLTSSRDSFT